MSKPLICDLCGTTISEHPTQFTQYAEIQRRGAMALGLNDYVTYDLCIGCFNRIFEKVSDPDENEEDCDGATAPLVLGHAELEECPDGLHVYCKFNDTAAGKNARESLYAIKNDLLCSFPIQKDVAIDASNINVANLSADNLIGTTSPGYEEADDE